MNAGGGGEVSVFRKEHKAVPQHNGGILCRRGDIELLGINVCEETNATKETRLYHGRSGEKVDCSGAIQLLIKGSQIRITWWCRWHRFSLNRCDRR